jgi:hypothetical protein
VSVSTSIPVGHLILKDTFSWRTVPDLKAIKDNEINESNQKIAKELDDHIKLIMRNGAGLLRINKHIDLTKKAYADSRGKKWEEISSKYDSSVFLDDTTYSDADRTVSRTFRNNSDHQIQAFMKIKYKNPSSNTKDRALESGRLQFGSSFVTLSPNNRSFILNIRWFNGRRFTLTPSRLSGPGIRADLESKSDFHRLSIEVRSPEARESP